MPQTRSGAGQTADSDVPPSSATITTSSAHSQETTNVPSAKSSQPPKSATSESSERDAAPDAVIAAIEAIRKMDALRLVIPNAVLEASDFYQRYPQHWAPHAFTPSTILSRATVTDDELEVPAKIAKGTNGDGGVWDIVLDKFIGQHREEWYDSYRASLRNPNGDLTPGLVVKIVDLPMNAAIEEGIEHLEWELANFEFAAGLEGKALPRFAGLFGRGTLFCFVFEDAGRTLTQTELITGGVWDEIERLLNELFSAGVYPGLEWYTWRTIFCRGHDGRIKLAMLDGSTEKTIAWRDPPHALKEAAERSMKRSREHLEDYKSEWEVSAKQDAKEQGREQIWR